MLIPVIAGVSYEFLSFAGKHDSKLVDILSRPGMWMQGLTTKEPDDTMIEVAIAAVEEVFDWRAYLDENFPGLGEERGTGMKMTLGTLLEEGKEKLEKQVFLTRFRCPFPFIRCI